MLKKTILLIVCVTPFEMFAQNQLMTQSNAIYSDSIISDTIKNNTDSIVSIKELTEQLEKANSIIEKQKVRLLELQDVETKLSKSQSDNSLLQRELEKVNKKANLAEYNLIVQASNFLYIPYEAYSIDEIAIKAFEIIQDNCLKQEYRQTYFLLKNYQEHLKEFKSYLQRVQKECNGVFQATATEFIDSNDPSISPDLILTRQRFYQDYVKYDGYQNTFIGRLIQKTQEILRAHTKQNRANMHELIDTIDKTQNPVKIDSISNVIEIIDERLKTIEDS